MVDGRQLKPLVGCADHLGRPPGLHPGFEFGNKAQTLAGVAHGKSFDVLPIHRIVLRSWLLDSEHQKRMAVARLGDLPMIVRSSASIEDGKEVSHAGEFDSVLNVSGDNLGSAVDAVFRSYGSPS